MLCTNICIQEEEEKCAQEAVLYIELERLALI